MIDPRISAVLRGAVAAFALATGACGAEEMGQPWEIEVEGLSAAALSIHEDGEGALWVTGADRRDGRGALLMRGGETAWETIDLRGVDPEGGHLWWGHSPVRGRDTWIVGDGGRIFRLGRRGREITRIESGTDASLYGIWGDDDEDLWAVGGYVFPRRGPPTIVRIRSGSAEVWPWPGEGPPEEGVLFKVWGRRDGPIRAVGERGLLLRLDDDGQGWVAESLPGEPRLVTVAGREGEWVAVGGTRGALIVEGRDRGEPAILEPTGASPLSGVWVRATGEAFAVGMLGEVLRRDGGWWRRQPTPLQLDWHAVAESADGAMWIVGGDLLSARRMDKGAILRRGPLRARRDAPAGLVPEPTDDATGGEDALPPDDGADDAGPTEDGEVIDEAMPSGLLVGADLEGFHALGPGAPVDLIHGPQGGFHLELIIRLTDLGDVAEARLDLPLSLSLEVDGRMLAILPEGLYPFWDDGLGYVETSMIPLIFAEGLDGGTPHSPDLDGREATLHISVTPPAEPPLVGRLRVTLRDTL